MQTLIIAISQAIAATIFGHLGILVDSEGIAIFVERRRVL
jgi:hypothetical protein